jgi:hypothetical protein
MFVPPRLPDQEANCSLRQYDILMDFTAVPGRPLESFIA